jgi:hypothetical protein
LSKEGTNTELKERLRNHHFREEKPDTASEKKKPILKNTLDSDTAAAATAAAAAKPTKAIKKIPTPKPRHDLLFSKTENYLVITQKEIVRAKIRFAGRYSDAEKYYEGLLKELGVPRFLELAQYHEAGNAFVASS